MVGHGRRRAGRWRIRLRTGRRTEYLLSAGALIVGCVLLLLGGFLLMARRGEPTGVAAPAGLAAPPAATPATASRSAAPTGSPRAAIRYRFPVSGSGYSYARTHHDYPAADIITNCGTPVLSPVPGVVLEESLVDLYDPKVNAGATRGGLSVSILGDDGVRYYGSHLSAVLDTVHRGDRVAAGQQLGRVGKTGDASVCHLHFGISPVCRRVADWWIRRGVIWPWPYLDSWRHGGNLAPLAEVTGWQAKFGCPNTPLVDP
jgi:peptidoglycan LD-endopeptidase LytH